MSWEPDVKHADTLVEEWSTNRNRRIELPVSAEWNSPSTGVAVTGAQATKFRSGAARVQYLSHDRADLSLAACILSTRMASPTESDCNLLGRIGDYLKLNRRRQIKYSWNGTKAHCLDVFTDSDWASCEQTRKSRSGCVIAYSGYTICHFTRTQEAIALSTAEAELRASCKGVTEALGIQGMMQFFVWP